MNTQENKKQSGVENLAIKATKWIGSPTSLVVHTLIFICVFLAILFGFNRDTVLLILTTIVSLEAIYLSIFIQMSVNRSDAQLTEVSKDIEEIQEDVAEIHEDVGHIEEDIDEIQKDVEEIEQDVDMIQKDVEEIQEEVEDIGEDMEGIEKGVVALGDDIEEIGEDIEADEATERLRDQELLVRMESALAILAREVQELKEHNVKKKKVVSKK